MSINYLEHEIVSQGKQGHIVDDNVLFDQDIQP